MPVLSEHGHPLLADVDLTASGLAELPVEALAAGTVCVREGDPPAGFWLLCSGSARAYYTSEGGAEITAKIFRAPAAWGELELITGHKHIENVTLTEASQAVRISPALFERLLAASPRFQRNLLADTCARCLIAAQHERLLAFASVEQRLAHFILSYARAHALLIDAAGLHVPLSLGELALGIGTTTKSVQRSLAKWNAAGLLARPRRGLIVRDVARLKEICGSDWLGLDWASGTVLRSAI